MEQCGVFFFALLSKMLKYVGVFFVEANTFCLMQAPDKI